MSGDISSQLLREFSEIRVAVYAMLLVVIVAVAGTMIRTYRYLRGGESFAKELLAPSYGLYAQVLVENVLYAAAVMVVACLVFARREIRLSS